jgi:hypothetical protein
MKDLRKLEETQGSTTGGNVPTYKQRQVNVRAPDEETQEGTWELPKPKEEKWTKVSSKKQP